VRVLTVLVRFGLEQYADAEQVIDDVFRRRMPEVDRTVLVVDNALPTDPVAARGARMLLGGDNTSREFSAFDRAIQFIGQDIWRFDLVHFATSAFNSLYVQYLERFDTRVLESVASRPVGLGHIDCYNEPVEVLNFYTQHWIRTGFFVLRPTEVKILGSFVTLRDGRHFFSGNPEALFRAEAPLGPKYRRYIVDWLTGVDIGQGVRWHSRLSVTSETLPAFENKALSILNEHLLAVRLRAMGCRLIDVTWLATMLARGGAASVQWDTTWQQQLANRDRDALLFPA
jgi:hypothetical protein